MGISFHADPDEEMLVIEALRAEGLDVVPGNGPMVDWRITEATDE